MLHEIGDGFVAWNASIDLVEAALDTPFEHAPNQRLEITQTIGTETFESRVTYEFELEADRYTKLTLINDRFAEADPNYQTNLDGWARFLSNLKSFIETGTVMHFHA